MRNYGDTNPAIGTADPEKALVNREDHNKLMAEILLSLSEMYPINSIKMWYDNEDHSDFLSMTWERCLVGAVPCGG